MNKRTMFSLLIVLASQSAFAIEAQRTEPVCAKLREIIQKIGVDPDKYVESVESLLKTDSTTGDEPFFEHKKKMEQALGMKLSSNSKVFNDATFHRAVNLFCSKYKYAFVTDEFPGEDQKRNRPTYGFSNEMDISRRNYKEVEHFYSPQQFAQLLAVMEQRLGQRKSLFVDKFRSAHIGQSIVIEETINYPDTTGKTKIEAKLLRKQHLQKTVKAMIEVIDHLPSLSPQITAFLEDNYPGPYSAQEIGPAARRVYDLKRPYELNDGAPLPPGEYPQYGLLKEHYIYIPGETVAVTLTDNKGKRTVKSLPTKDALTIELSKSPELRAKIYAFLLKSVSTIDLKRTSKSQVSIKLTVDISKAHKLYKFTNASELMD